eukprot:c32139_g1_i1.p1 GENE.c32139_g1_i1~~c32139_g1_i1.p1  ORF type:complete len:529 (-),score=89.07 c32139_g1_i1:37-1623(-)
MGGSFQTCDAAMESVPRHQMKTSLLSESAILSSVAPEDRSSPKRVFIVTTLFAVCAIAATIALSVTLSSSSSTTVAPTEEAQIAAAFSWPWSGCPVAPALSSVRSWAEQLLVALPSAQPTKAQLATNQPFYGRFFHTTSPGCIEGATFETRARNLITKHSTVPSGKEEWVNGAYVNNWKGQPITDAEFALLNFGILRPGQKYPAVLRWSNASPGPDAKQGDQRGLGLKIMYGSANPGRHVDESVVRALGLTDLVNKYGLNEQVAASIYNPQEQDIIMSTAQFFPARNDQLASDLVVALASGKFSSMLGAITALLSQSWSSLIGSSQNPLRLLSAANDSGDTDKNLCSRDPFTSTHFSQSTSRLGSADSAISDLLNSNPSRGTYIRYKLAPCEEVCQRHGCDANCLGHSTTRKNMQQSLADHFSIRPSDPVCYNLYVQVAQSNTCVEDASALWTGSSYYKVANVTFDRANLMEPAACEALTFNPFNGLMEHMPVGLNRMRLLTYAISQKARLTQPAGQPDSDIAHYRSF